MDRQDSTSQRSLKWFVAVLAAMPFAVLANTIGVLKKFRWNSSSADSRRLLRSPFSPMLIDRLEGDASVSDSSSSGALLKSPEQVESIQQKVGSAAIAGTWIQRVRDRKGSLLFETGEAYNIVPEGLRFEVAKLESQKSTIAEQLSKHVAELATASQKFEPELEIVTRDGNFEINWLMDFVDASGTKAFQVRADATSQLIGVKEVGNRVSEGVGNVFPSGPKRSAMSAVPFQGLDGSGGLKTLRSSVTSAAAPEAHSANLDFRFDPADPRFDQVQAFFYAEEILGWFKEKFGAESRSQLQITVQVGDRSNTAFYLRDTIRLGSGDGRRYDGLARDPSIVMHEVGHAIVDRYAGLPSDGEGGSINEAFADYFSASLLDNPAMGEASFLAGPFVRTLENGLVAPRDLGRGLYKDSQVFSGTLWQIRQSFGPEKSDVLAFRGLSRLGAGGKFADFGPALKLAAASILDEAGLQKLNEILTSRGLNY
jgi:hypothetical protein